MEKMNIKPKTLDQIEKIVDTKETEELMACIKENLEKKFISIGEGGNAVVYVAQGTPFEKICFKKVKEKPQIVCNDIYKEHDFQEMAKAQGVRTPLTLLSVKTKDATYLVMEKIDGCSIKDIISNPELLPEKFDFKKFCDSLDDQISKLHSVGNLKGNEIYHRDLHEGNVMINSEGEAVIIDFGTATLGTGSDFTYEESVSMYNEKNGRYEYANGYFKDDMRMSKYIKESVKMFAANKLTI